MKVQISPHDALHILMYVPNAVCTRRFGSDIRVETWRYYNNETNILCAMIKRVNQRITPYCLKYIKCMRCLSSISVVRMWVCCSESFHLLISQREIFVRVQHIDRRRTKISIITIVFIDARIRIHIAICHIVRV